ncbi:MAG: indole-3-glycerol phosphate synthase TrpC [Firmicutes bacterium]|nr:indole-3-glycerol phosphate synthase TrpC [Bacillota bacterium]
MCVMILDQIVAQKRTEVERLRSSVSLAELTARAEAAPPPRPFRRALLHSPYPVSLIAEVKRASPSKGLIRPDFDPVEIARIYESHGAAAISVLTDERFFQGSLDYLVQIREAVDLPLLRKEFIIDEYQVLESRAAGADAVLLIVACLTPDRLAEFLGMARQLGMDAIVEVHDEKELSVALDVGADLVGINNRNLKTFETTLDVTRRLAARIPKEVPFISESGIFTRDDVLTVGRVGARAILVGESLMRRQDIGAHIKQLMGAPEPAAGGVG